MPLFADGLIMIFMYSTLTRITKERNSIWSREFHSNYTGDHFGEVIWGADLTPEPILEIVISRMRKRLISHYLQKPLLK